MTLRRNLLLGGFALTVLTLLLSTGRPFQATVGAQQKMAPRFEVDPLWPKPLPNHWRIGSTIGVGTDAKDHVYIVHRPGSLTRNELHLDQGRGPCCAAAPPVLQFDPAGNLVRSWGGPGKGYEWPESGHGITVDTEGNLWMGGNGGNDDHFLQFTPEGKFLRQFGFAYANGGSNDPWAYNQVAKLTVDLPANEVYVADGYGNRRVAVVDIKTGKMKRHWGAYGNKPDDRNSGAYDPNAKPAQQFRPPVHCVEISKDGLVYVCDRGNNRIQVFKKDGTYVRELVISPKTKDTMGTAFDVAFSADPQQRFLYVANGADDRVHIVERATMEILTQFGDGGRQPGAFYCVHSIATDTKGNIYTTETFEGKRVQKFVYKGLAPVQKFDQGVVWPTP